MPYLLKNCMQARVCVLTMYTETLECTQKMWMQILKFFISKTLERCFAGMFCYYFIETSFELVHL